MAMSRAPTPRLILVDGCNVRRSRWPNLSNEELVAALSRWSPPGAPAELVVIFDGRVDTALLRSSAPRVVESGDESADDLLVRTAREAKQAGSQVQVATSDRALRSRLQKVGATIPWGGGNMLFQLGIQPGAARRGHHRGGSGRRGE